MRALFCLILFVFISISTLFAQDNEQQLAIQYNANGEPQKALEIYQKLFKQNSEVYYTFYVNTLLKLKKIDEAESALKKLARKHPEANEYPIMLGSVYTQQGNANKADAIYDDIIKKMPADQMEITNLASLFYQAGSIDNTIKVFIQGRKVMHNDNAFTYDLINMYRLKRDKPSLVEEYLNFLPNNPVYTPQAESTFGNILENEADFNILKTALLKRIQKDPQQIVYAELLTWQFLQQKQYDLALNQALALSRRQNDDGNSIYDLCSTLNANQAYDEAIRGYEYIIAKGKTQSLYIPAKIELINTKNLKITSGKYESADLLELEQDYNSLLTEFGRNSNTAFAMQKLANLQAYKLHKLKDAQKLLEDAILIPGLRPDLMASCKLDLGDVYLLNNLPWDATLLYSQVEKDFPNTNTAQDAKFRNAKMAYYTGDFTWAKGQLDVLKAATSQLIANDALNLLLLIQDNTLADSTGAALKVYARADLHIFAEQPAQALMALDSIDKKFPGNSLGDDILMAKSRIFIQQKSYNDAIPLLKKIFDEHPNELWADDAVFMLGDIYENHLNDKATAQTWYQKIITNYPGSLWINEARKRFRLLRGDKAES